KSVARSRSVVVPVVLEVFLSELLLGLVLRWGNHCFWVIVSTEHSLACPFGHLFTEKETADASYESSYRCARDGTSAEEERADCCARGCASFASGRRPGKAACQIGQLSCLLSCCEFVVWNDAAGF